MKRHITILALLLLLAASCNTSVSSKENEKGKITAYINGAIEKYPLITLSDIYKGAFQDYMGPAHIIPDRESARAYIAREIENAGSLSGELYESCSWMGNYYRVNLSVIKMGLVSIDTFTDAFVKSAKGIDSLLVKEWQEIWESALPAIREAAPQMEGFGEDSARISNLLQQGRYVIHHSDIFNATYHPHYRIMEKNIFEKEILPLLK